MNIPISPRRNSASDEEVNLGDGRIVSMQTVQQIYYEITGQKEELSAYYSINHQASFQDLSHLNSKIQQICEQYNIVGSNCSVHVYFVDDQKEVFSSFKRFEAYDRSSPNPVERIRLRYNFLIILPKIDSPQSYEIEVEVVSRAAIVKRTRKMEDGSGMVFRYFIAGTGSMKITYVDYMVARNFKQSIDDWFKTLPKIESNAILGKFRRHSRHLPFLFRVVSVSIFLAVCYKTFYLSIYIGEISILGIYKIGLLSFGGTFLVSMLSSKAGAMTMEESRKTHAVSYIDLTRGDREALSELKRSNKKCWRKAAGSIIFVVLLNVFSAWVAFSVGVGSSDNFDNQTE